MVIKNRVDLSATWLSSLIALSMMVSLPSAFAGSVGSKLSNFVKNGSQEGEHQEGEDLSQLSLLSLPPEILVYIAENLEPIDLVRGVGQTNHLLHQIVNEPGFRDKIQKIKPLRYDFEKDFTDAGHVVSVAFSPDGTQIASGSRDLSIKVRNIETGEIVQKLNVQDPLFRYPVAFSPDGKFIVSEGSDRKIKFWNVETGEELKTLDCYSCRVDFIAFSPVKTQLAFGGGLSIASDMVRVLDYETGKVILVPGSVGAPRHSGTVRSVAFFPNGERIASGSCDRTVKIWDIETRTLVHTLNGHRGAVNSIMVSPDGNLVVSGSVDRSVKLWDVESGTLLKTLNGHEGAVNSVQFSPDGKLIASGSLDHTVKIWNVETGNLIETLIGHEGAVNSIMFSPDGSRLISGSSDRKIKVWRRNGLRISSGSSDQDSEAEISLFRSLLGFLLN